MNAIACINNKRFIGKDGKLLYHISDDLRFFKEKTINNIVIMGRTTLESFPNKRPLPDRINVVLTRNTDYTVNEKEAVIAVHSIEELQEKILRVYDTNKIWVIGGASIYEQLLKYCDHVYLTHVFDNQEGDVKFPELDTKHWMINDASEEYLDPKSGLHYVFDHYIRY